MLPIGSRDIFLPRTQKASHRLQMLMETCPSVCSISAMLQIHKAPYLWVFIIFITYSIITVFIFLTIRLALSILPYTAGPFSFYIDLFFKSQCKLPRGKTNHRLHLLGYQLTSAYTFQATNLHAISISHC